MSYQVIRNMNYKRDNLTGIYRHNNRLNEFYTNKDINRELTYQNYFLKKSDSPYESKALSLKKENNLKGQIQKTSNLVCEYIITSDKAFFEKMSLEEEKLFFTECFNFVVKQVEEKNIIEAVVHKDEKTPHLHITFLPVVDSIDKKTNEKCRKLSCSEFWKGKDSYQKLQDSFQNYIREKGYNLKRGKSDREHLSVEDYKEITNYNDRKKLVEISTKPLTIPEIDKLGKKDAREELKIKVQELAQVKSQNKELFLQNKKFIKSLNIAENLEIDNKNLQVNIRELKEENFTLKSDYRKLAKKYNKLYDVFEYFITRIQSLFFTISHIFTNEQKNNNPREMNSIEYICNTKADTIIQDISEDYETEEKTRKHQKEYDLEL